MRNTESAHFACLVQRRQDAAARLDHDVILQQRWIGVIGNPQIQHIETRREVREDHARGIVAVVDAQTYHLSSGFSDARVQLLPHLLGSLDLNRKPHHVARNISERLIVHHHQISSPPDVPAIQQLHLVALGVQRAQSYDVVVEQPRILQALTLLDDVAVELFRTIFVNAVDIGAERFVGGIFQPLGPVPREDAQCRSPSIVVVGHC
mmetsp:Transcript_1793/g.3686  ORF Transcript_1793/g.3686 Transcript_1793/m.3686 type:complete len:207 (-) Transcript_1793:423-1043(-)